MNVSPLNYVVSMKSTKIIHLACKAAGNNYAPETASNLARASEHMNICQQSDVSALLVGG